ncbi:MAG: 2-C-methyl-D-erythritol 4-phosphate cytidylyltransferase [Lachnospiraceae bacterium]|nr:2-C-methyl-D-erythritol 4-phosphate cytidylyltransferase [Lachnospiraceae bacterium]
MKKDHLVAIVLSAGKGLRMGGDIPKQYMNLNGRPVIYYSLRAFEDSIADEVVLVCGEGDEEFVKHEIVEKYGFTKVRKIVPGGKERYNSVYNGLVAYEASAGGLSDNGQMYVFIHDGARPLLTPEMIAKLYEEVKLKKAVIAACHAKDTIKVADDSGLVKETPDRRTLWQVQTPQVFEYELIKNAYEKMIAANDSTVTDDAMVTEKYSDSKVYLCDTGSGNIKITTAEDLVIAGALLKNLEC